jgi:hypothetical protein
VLVIGALVIAACQRSPQTPPASQAPTLNHVEAAKSALAVRDWAGAAPHLRAALAQDPNNLFLHYNLAICATWLDQTAEAAREFQWVLEHAASGSDEATTARRWLAGQKTGTSTPTASAPGADPNVGDSGVRGVAIWGDAGQAPLPLSRYQLFLIGLRGTPTKEFFRVLRTDRDGTYEFKQVPAGSYKLTDSIGPGPKWRLKVTLEAGRNLALDLTPDNGVQRRDDLPEGK